MMTTIVVKAITLLALLVGTEQAKVNFEREFDDFPGFRYTPWASLSSEMQGMASSVGYTSDTWDNMGTIALEDTAWDELGGDVRTTLRNMGFREDTWDCYVNHFASYTWNDLVLSDLADTASIMGYTAQTWDSGGTVAADQEEWEELSDAQQWAASDFCFFSDSWNGVSIPEMSNIPTIYPYFRYVMWDDLPAETQGFALQAGWEEDDWNTPDKSWIEYKKFSELPDGERKALFAMGFYEEQYDCYVNHYYGYSWDELTKYGLAEYYQAFGWTELAYSADDPAAPTAWEADWDQLTAEQKDAADNLCWFEEIWEEITINEWGNPMQFPEIRYRPWGDLSGRQREMAASLGYSRATWDEPGTAAVEASLFDDQTMEAQHALRGLGFFSADQYDCYVNHYNGLDWSDLEVWDILEYVQVLGWTEESWGGKKSPPASDDKAWDDLSETEKDAADALCYFAEVWDRSPLTVWEGVAWPEDRYWPWELLDANEQQLLQRAGWTKDTWNTPGSAGFEYTSWNVLPTVTREALEEWGFYHDQWNCYMNHYDDYAWFELVLEDVAEYFEAFGWTEDTWEVRSEEPEDWNADWEELSEAQQDAAWEICYFRENWNDLPLSEWSPETRSGGPLNTSNRSSTSGGGGDRSRPGLWIFFVLLALAFFGGIYYYKTRNMKETYDPTAPVKQPPTEAMEANYTENFTENTSDEGDLKEVRVID